VLFYVWCKQRQPSGARCSVRGSAPGLVEYLRWTQRNKCCEHISTGVTACKTMRLSLGISFESSALRSLFDRCAGIMIRRYQPLDRPRAGIYFAVQSHSASRDEAPSA
jgi:hypothetical protein